MTRPALAPLSSFSVPEEIEDDLDWMIACAWNELDNRLTFDELSDSGIVGTKLLLSRVKRVRLRVSSPLDEHDYSLLLEVVELARTATKGRVGATGYSAVDAAEDRRRFAVIDAWLADPLSQSAAVVVFDPQPRERRSSLAEHETRSL